MIVFQSLTGPTDKSFIAPLHQIYNVRVEPNSGRLHIELGDKRRNYNFFGYSVNSSSSTAQLQPNANIGLTQFNCSGACFYQMEGLYRLIEHAKKLPSGPSAHSEGNQKDITMNIVHWSLNEKNKHAGILKYSPSGVSWTETGANADAKHNFEASCAEVKLEWFGSSMIKMKFERHKKSKNYTFECPSCVDKPDSTISLVYDLIKKCGLSLASN